MTIRPVVLPRAGVMPHDALELCTDGPAVIRWPKTMPPEDDPLRRWARLSARAQRRDICLLAVGKMLAAAREAAEQLAAEGIEATVDAGRGRSTRSCFDDAAEHPAVVTIEDGYRGKASARHRHRLAERDGGVAPHLGAGRPCEVRAPRQPEPSWRCPVRRPRRRRRRPVAARPHVLTCRRRPAQVDPRRTCKARTGCPGPGLSPPSRQVTVAELGVACHSSYRHLRPKVTGAGENPLIRCSRGSPRLWSVTSTTSLTSGMAW